MNEKRVCSEELLLDGEDAEAEALNHPRSVAGGFTHWWMSGADDETLLRILTPDPGCPRCKERGLA